MNTERDYDLANQAAELARDTQALIARAKLLHLASQQNASRDYHAPHDQPPDQQGATGIAMALLHDAAKAFGEAEETLAARAQWCGDWARG